MMSGDDELTQPVARRIEIFTGAGRRRRWDAETKARLVAESYASSVGEVADRHGLARTQLFAWRRAAQVASAAPAFAQVEIDDVIERQSGLDLRNIEIRIGTTCVRIPPGAEASMVTTVLAALRARR